MTATAIEFRGELRDVVVDRYEIDYSTNAVEIEWHFDGLSPEEHDALALTEREEDEIATRLSEIVEELWD